MVNTETRTLHSSSAVEVWSCIDGVGREAATVVRYSRDAPKHLRAFESHMEMLLNNKSHHVVQVAGAYTTAGSVCMVVQPLRCLPLATRSRARP